MWLGCITEAFRKNKSRLHASVMAHKNIPHTQKHKGLYIPHTQKHKGLFKPLCFCVCGMFL